MSIKANLDKAGIAYMHPRAHGCTRCAAITGNDAQRFPAVSVEFIERPSHELGWFTAGVA